MVFVVLLAYTFLLIQKKGGDCTTVAAQPRQLHYSNYLFLALVLYETGLIFPPRVPSPPMFNLTEALLRDLAILCVASILSMLDK